MKKRCTFTMIWIFVFILIFGSISVFAETPISIKIGSVTAKAGDTVTVPINVSAGSGIAAFNGKINFDASKLELTDIKAELFKGGLFDKNIGKTSFVFATTTPITESGIIVNLVFKVLPETEGEVAIGLEITEILDKNIKDISDSASVQSGKININDEAATSSSTKPTTSSSSKSSSSISSTKPTGDKTSSSKNIDGTVSAPKTSGPNLGIRLLLVLCLVSITIIIGVLLIRKNRESSAENQ